MIEISNHGPLIVSTDYWSSDVELRQAKYAILSRGPWPEMGLADAVEILWEDHSDNPHA